MGLRSIAISALALALTGCPKPPVEPPHPVTGCEDGPNRKSCKKEWTVMIYMAADNDLQEEAYKDLDEMGAASTGAANVIVQLDVKNPDGIRRMNVVSGSRSPVVMNVPEDTTPPAEAFRSFLSWAIAEYPSNRYGVIVWGHGAGYRSRAAGFMDSRSSPRVFGGVAFDDTQGTVLDIESLGAALATVGTPIDLFSWDACLMQSAEVAAEIAPFARFIVGPEQIEENSGLPYGDVIPLFNGSRSPPAAGPACKDGDSACAIAVALPEIAKRGVITANQDPRSHAARDAFTLSAISSTPFQTGLYPGMNRLGKSLSAWLSESRVKRSIAVATLIGPETGFSGGLPGFYGGTHDLGVFLHRLEIVIRNDMSEPEPHAKAPDVLSAIDAVRTALKQAVIASAFGPNYKQLSAEGIAGLAVWIPSDPGELSTRGKLYADSKLFKAAPDWRPFLDQALGTSN